MTEARTEISQEVSIVQDSPFGASIVLNLPIFEGPMDLLLFLIKKNEIDIFDIPIALIASEYLQYLELMKARDLNVGGEFLVLAATLLSIKARMLLPCSDAETSAEEEDPRRELVERILEYRAFKESAVLFRALEEVQSDCFYHTSTACEPETSFEEYLQDVSLFDLLTAFKTVIDRLNGERPSHNVYLIPETINQRMDFIRTKLGQQRKYLFSELIVDLNSRIIAILTFLAILELVRIGEIALKRLDGRDFILLAKATS
ncbi:MAG: segregation/condensation protein A [bacterium]